MIETKIVSGGHEAVAALAEEWTRLLDENGQHDPFSRPEWFAAFAKNFEAFDLLTVRIDGSLRAVLPIARRREAIHGLPVRKAYGAFNLNTPRFDLIHSGKESERPLIAKALWDHLKLTGEWDVLEFRLVKRDSWLSDLLELARKEKHLTGIWQMDAAPFVDVPPLQSDPASSLESFFTGARKHLGKELARRLRRLNEMGHVEFVTATGFESDLIERYLELENRGWKGRIGTAAVCDSRAAGLHQDFAKSMANNDSLLVYELKLDGTTIAMSINIRSGPKTIHWKTSYDESFAKYSPGNLLFKKLLEDCISAGSSEIDFLSPSTPNKRFWATGEREHVAFYIFQRGVLGALAFRWTFSVVNRLRKYKASQPKPSVKARRPTQILDHVRAWKSRSIDRLPTFKEHTADGQPATE
ncbi:MAG: GNAT family N-acetyltransferase [Pyrinomonadaceae bacterium]